MYVSINAICSAPRYIYIYIFILYILYMCMYVSPHDIFTLPSAGGLVAIL